MLDDTYEIIFDTYDVLKKYFMYVNVKFQNEHNS